MLMNGFDNGVIPLLGYAMLALAVVAFVLALMARDDAYRAADKKTKTFWLVILGITILVDFFLGMLFLQIAGLVASIVFMVDVRPALKQVSGGGRRSGGSSSDGPYGPYNGGR
ncbi:DUF2516 family protein [Streptomyces sp. NPDC060334]|uniref:DUF2516 family protein n=1 Tax=unclassified Streptomyces TaxID=2593676 RepID=UPI0006AFF451|nr:MULTISPECIES: DUF2516 family protein [unclassified Streptomyces]KOU46316.1 membrane protein [Streptomyces sp. WM4235]MCX5074198.1 DUF2516 family protein [Streptomyces sp. NBC_00424]MCX5154250.1 DUF2516 family protein [Streptomyces sp. NBC_00291]WUD42600.1 DUF2516 family protein [Streptomyces sp. NBC_00513]